MIKKLWYRIVATIGFWYAMNVKGATTQDIDFAIMKLGYTRELHPVTNGYARVYRKGDASIVLEVITK